MRGFSRRQFLRAGALALPWVAAGCAMPGNQSRGTERAAADEFVSVRNGRFELRGKPYAYIGANLWFGCYLGEVGLPGGRVRLKRELDNLCRVGVTNLRLLAGSEASRLVAAIRRGITRRPGNWDEDLLCGLDFCLAEMARRDMRAVLFLSNYWQWSGGFAQYVQWATGESIPDPDLPTMAAGDWGAFMRFSARFYATPAANDLYLAYAGKLLCRRNTVNGRVYREDPTIMAWELANEPRPGPDDEDTLEKVSNFYAWIDRTARFLRERAPQQLVCTGSEGIMGCLTRPEIFLAAHQTDAIDYVTVHMWLKNWGWLKTVQISPEFEAAAARAREHVETHTRIATEQLGKPLVLEEFGLARDLERCEPSSSTDARDEYFRRMFQQVADSFRAGRALQGANFWTWGGEGRVHAGQLGGADSFLGDPFCEPQGLNSVFDADATTLAVIANANRVLAGV
jgi:mannan endo-1,4-beta-mannosidase